MPVGDYPNYNNINWSYQYDDYCRCNRCPCCGKLRSWYQYPQYPTWQVTCCDTKTVPSTNTVTIN